MMCRLYSWIAQLSCVYNAFCAYLSRTRQFLTMSQCGLARGLKLHYSYLEILGGLLLPLESRTRCRAVVGSVGHQPALESQPAVLLPRSCLSARSHHSRRLNADENWFFSITRIEEAPASGGKKPSNSRVKKSPVMGPALHARSEPSRASSAIFLCYPILCASTRARPLRVVPHWQASGIRSGSLTTCGDLLSYWAAPRHIIRGRVKCPWYGTTGVSVESVTVLSTQFPVTWV